MGIKSFSKIFEGKEIKLPSLKDSTISIDASVIAYQAALGIKNINALTDSDGNPTIHINVVISKCINFKKNKIKQLWIFDYHEKGYVNPVKKLEVDRRNATKKIAKKKLEKLKEEKTSDDLFSSDDEQEKEDRICMQEKACFSMNDKIINDIKFILDCFGIQWCDSPKGFEAESICALLTNSDNDIKSDAVWSTDTDSIIYGSKKLIREIKVKSKKVLILYELNKILDENELTIDDLRKIAVIAGCDHCSKTPKVGPKTILKKYKDVELTTEQKNAVKIFEKSYDVSKLKWNNSIESPFSKKEKIKNLLDWLESKNFNRERIHNQISKVMEL